jgi:hypothetical protein
MNESVDTPKLLYVNVISAACHMANRAYCIGIGDTSQPTWESAPEWQKNSIRSGVRAMLENPSQTPVMSHEGWLNYKKAEGWKYGPVKNVKLKEHPCLVPYDQLPEDQRRKDELFISTVRSMSEVLGIF